MNQLLLVEDEIKTARSIYKGLTENGFQVDLSDNGEDALERTRQTHYDLIISDILMPKLNGIEFCKSLRNENNKTPVLMLTALGQISDKVEGFQAGSDDYLVKPFDFTELLLRIQALLRRNTTASAENSFQIQDLKINFDSKLVWRGDKEINLTAKEFALLEFFVHNRHRCITKEEIAKSVWNVDFKTGTNFVEVYVSYLRNKIDKDYPNKLIHTRKGIGYFFRTVD